MNPFKKIQIVEDICKLIGEEPKKKTFDYMRSFEIEEPFWDVILHQLPFILSRINDFTYKPIDQMTVFKIINAVHNQKEEIWNCVSNKDRELYIIYSDCILFMSDLHETLLDKFGISIDA